MANYNKFFIKAQVASFCFVGIGSAPMYVYMYVCIYVCIYVYVYVCVYVYMCLCMYVYMCYTFALYVMRTLVPSLAAWGHKRPLYHCYGGI